MQVDEFRYEIEQCAKEMEKMKRQWVRQQLDARHDDYSSAHRSFNHKDAYNRFHHLNNQSEEAADGQASPGGMGMGSVLQVSVNMPSSTTAPPATSQQQPGPYREDRGE